MSARRKGGNTFLSSGLPLVAFIVGGAYITSEFVQGKIGITDSRGGSKSIRQFTLEEEHRKTMKEFSEDYEIKRIPRPDEDKPPE